VGQHIGKKGTTTIRLVLQNVDGFSQDENMDLKLELLHCFVTDHNIDAFGFTEANTCWDMLPPQQWLQASTRGWWENAHWSLGYNQTELHTRIYQPGGMGVLVVNNLSHCITHSGDDPSGMGRWSWVQLQGREQFTICIVSFYHPCYLTGPSTTYQQQI